MNRLRDGRLDALQSELERLKVSYAAAKDRTASAKAAKDRAYQDVDYCKRELSQVRDTYKREREAARVCHAAGNHYDGRNHGYNADNLRPRMDALSASKDRAYDSFNSAKAAFDSALAEQRRIKADMDRVREQLQQRRNELHAEHERERAMWAETRCAKCGKTIRYRKDWGRVPNMCKECREAEKAKWREKPCKGCGKTIRYNIEWAHPPNYCKDCKAKR